MLTKSIGALRWLAAAAFLGSIVWQVEDRLANNLFRPTEYFAYFSIITAEVCVVSLAVSGWFAWSGKTETKVLTIVRLVATSCMVVVSSVYNLLLRGVWGPIFILLDWLLIQYGPKLRLRASLWVAAYPLAWLAFSVVRGLATDWWPYWFINPNEKGGVTGMVTYIVAITVLLIGAGFILLLASMGTRKLVRLQK
jgi:hypothetical protein